MIMADQPRPPVPLRPDRGEQGGGIDLERAGGIGGDVAGGDNIFHPFGLTKEKPANLPIRIGRRLREDPVEKSS